MKRVYRVSEGVEGSEYFVVADGALNIEYTLADLLDCEVEALRINWVRDETEKLLEPTQATLTVRSLQEILGGNLDCLISQYDPTPPKTNGGRARPIWEIVEAIVPDDV